MKTQTGAPPAHPIDNEIPGIVNIRSDQPPGIDVPTLKEESSSSKTAKLNLGIHIHIVNFHRGIALEKVEAR